ncbi:hypothetical protein CAY60_018170 [Shouchella clausii]|uniref:DUF6414 family protein n=1 Tax=Shouchella TaxID=2893057 RepID=UPI0004E6FB0E|nr:MULTISPECIES: hypothetical protein [Shouchella]ALA55081.1 hypothetical protein DB29_04253 [Shouchella clausii]MBU3231055.1 hypothetical protein [Shouchella clausii]MBU3262870.1 hypothetical protein [Shouchella clausii]MBU3505334.1 hypothetical protein [Shouchella clausii]MBU3534900.1 hypothetical protein [Shouchella clausii]
MKDIIYLDVDLMNSMLAQLENGLSTTYSREGSSQREQASTITSGDELSSGLNAGISLSSGAFPGGSLNLGTRLGGKGSETNSETDSLTEGQRDILNKQFHDFALDKLLYLLKEEGMLSTTESASEGSLILADEPFRFYDFNLIKSANDPELFESVALGEANLLDLSYQEAQKIVTKTKPNAQERKKMSEAEFIVNSHKELEPTIKLFKQLYKLNTYANNLLPNLVLIKTGNKKIGLLKEDNLRHSTASLSFRTNISRNARFLVRVIGRKETVMVDGALKKLPNMSEEDLDRLPTYILDILLGSFKIIEKNDLVVTPIAIFYE